MDEQTDVILNFAEDLGMSARLAHDMWILSGRDETIIREASQTSSGIESMKCRIIDARLQKLEAV